MEQTAQLKIIRGTAEGGMIYSRIVRALRAKGLTVYTSNTETGSGRRVFEIRVPIDHLDLAEKVLWSSEW